MKIAAIVLGVLAVLVGAISYNIWRGEQPILSTPGLFEAGKMQLHQQLEEAQKIESEAEKQHWDSPSALRQLIKWHRQRIEKLTGNSQAGEILVYDQAAVDRLETRITALGVLEAAREEAAKEAAQEAAKEAARKAEQESQNP